MNNPCAVALHEAKQLWPNQPIQCVVSFGTGRTPNRICDNNNDSMDVMISSWKDKFYKILDSATDTEGNVVLSNTYLEHVYPYVWYLSGILILTIILSYSCTHDA